MKAPSAHRGLLWWGRLERWFIGALGLGALALAAHRILTRYVFTDWAVIWTDEVLVYMLIGATFVAGSLLVEEDAHVRADLVLRLLPPGAQRAVEIVNSTLALVFCALLCWFGLQVARDAWQLGERSLTPLAFPMWIYYGCLPLGAALMTLRYLRRLARYLWRFDAATMAPRSGRES
jgi:TRAP-type C4-dicarboxylate transport system permease small subunit